jgi:alkylmercury lyase
MPDDCASRELGLLSRHLGVDGLSRLLALLAEGRPLGRDEVAVATGQPIGRAEDLLREQVGTDWDEDGRLIGFGLTQRQTPHPFVVGGRVLYTWCAMDTLFFPVLLNRPAAVSSACPATGQTIAFEVTPRSVRALESPDAVVSQLVSTGLVDDIRAAVCDHGHFFASAEAAAPWLANHPAGQILAIRDAFSAARSYYSPEMSPRP